MIVVGLLGKSPALNLGVPAELISVAGATLFGASLMSFIENFIGTDVSDIRKYLFKREKFESAPDYLDMIVGTWHVYYLTKKGGKVIWRSAIYKLEKNPHVNSVHGRSYIVADGKSRSYAIEAGIRGNSLIAVHKAETGQEDDSIEVFPSINRTYRDVHFGIQVLETWDGDLAVSYSLLSREEIPNSSDPENLNMLLEDAMRSMKIGELAQELKSSRLQA
ncbi:MAG: hypothetical protein H6899_09775 [Rhodobacter sp.]|nr:hypothetical protein [Rhodobacter sp.]